MPSDPKANPDVLHVDGDAIIEMLREVAAAEYAQDHHRAGDTFTITADFIESRFPVSAEPSPNPLREALGMAIYHADNLRRLIDLEPVRDLAESAAGLEQARRILSGDGGSA